MVPRMLLSRQRPSSSHTREGQCTWRQPAVVKRESLRLKGEQCVSSYVLSHELSGERQRLALMSELLDPFQRAVLKRLGLRPGWRCLEVGCGNGSISRWLSEEVSGGGHVVASDVDTSYLADLHASNLEVRRLNILDSTVERRAYDLVTARAVLHHIQDRKRAIRNMLAALKPGGLLLCIEPDFLPATASEPPSLRNFWEAWLKWSSSVGIDYFLGRKMPELLAHSGVERVGAEGTTAIYNGGSPWAKYWLETVNELRPKLVESRFLNEQSLTTFSRFYQDQHHWTSAIIFVGAWGYQPHGSLS